MNTKSYKMIARIYEGEESTEPDKHMAEIRELPGCRAWGDTREEAVDFVADLAIDFVRDSIKNNTLSPLIEPVESMAMSARFRDVSTLQEKYQVDWISTGLVELTVYV